MHGFEREGVAMDLVKKNFRPQVVILTDQAPLRQRWTAMLLPVADVVDLAADNVSLDFSPDGVVADLTAEISADWNCGVLRIGNIAELESPSQCFGQSGMGVSASAQPDVGSTPADSVFLAEDVTARELQTACLLMVKITHLRRQLEVEAALRSRFRDEALNDPLTGLPNRRAWRGVVRERLAPFQQREFHGGVLLSLCLAILDLDWFKRINDEHGHIVGDKVLVCVGQAMTKSLRHGDFVARLGGDEFGLMLNVPDASTAELVLERVRASLPTLLAQHALPTVTASIGYSLVSPLDGAISTESLYTAADTALRLAKEQGRNRILGLR
jgi:diguanylate cyclase (GGDEF)-like protein